MAEKERAKHAHGSRKNLENAIATGIVNEYDVLFLSGEGEIPAMGWVDKNGNPIIIESADLSGVEAELATKADAEKVAELSNQIATKIDAEEVGAMIDEKVAEVNSAYEIIEF